MHSGWNLIYGTEKAWQELGDSNPRPSVLETDALPTELNSYAFGGITAAAGGNQELIFNQHTHSAFGRYFANDCLRREYFSQRETNLSLSYWYKNSRRRHERYGR